MRKARALSMRLTMLEMRIGFVHRKDARAQREYR
jgi:hypothetical protein